MFENSTAKLLLQHLEYSLKCELDSKLETLFKLFKPSFNTKALFYAKVHDLFYILYIDQI